jgi:chitodextrinase
MNKLANLIFFILFLTLSACGGSDNATPVTVPVSTLPSTPPVVVVPTPPPATTPIPVITPDTLAPAAPAALTSTSGTVTSTGVSISWLASTDNQGVVGYEVWRNNVLLQSTPANQMTFTDAGLSPGTSYTYTVRAIDASGNASPFSPALLISTQANSTPADITAPSTPGTPRAGTITASSLTINWNPSTDNQGIGRYEVYNGTTLIASTVLTTFTLTGLTANTPYSLTIKAFDASGNASATSTALTVTTAAAAVTPVADTTAPSTPTGLVLTQTTTNALTINWAPSTDNIGVAGYNILRNGIKIGTTSIPGYIYTGLTASTAYNLSTQAFDAAGNTSATSAVLAATTASVAPVSDTTAPSSPTGLTFTSATTSSITFSWTASTDNVAVTGYQVFNGSTQVGSPVTAISTTVTGLTASTSYSFKLRALDAAGNVSGDSAVLVAATAAAGGPTVVTLPINEQPFGTLQLVDEIDTTTVAPSQQIPAGTSGVQTVLGRNARTVAPGDTPRFITYRVGAAKGLVAKQAYVLDIEYPDDVGRGIFVANRGADFVRGFATGSATGDVRRTYTPPTLESIAYPQSGTWKNYRSLFYLHERFSPLTAQRNAECANRSLLPADGFDVTVFQARSLNDPRSNGLAIGKIRLYKVVDTAALPATINYPGTLPKRHIYWREEMADEAVMGSTVNRRAVTDPIDWFVFKMDMGRALGFDTVGKDMMEWGFNQGFDSGDETWMFNAQGLMSNIWGQIVTKAAQRNLYVFPYLEYGGSLAWNCSAGQPCDRTPGNYKSLGFQRRSKKLFDGVYAADGESAKDRYTAVWWTEDKSADLTDPDTLTDFKKVMDKLLVQYKGQANFLGAWLRVRQTKLPMSFSAEAVARYNADNPGATRTIAQLQSTESSRASYYTWWYEKRRAFLLAIRDYIRTQVGDNSLQVHFTAYADEPVPRAYDLNPTEASSPLNLITDDPAWWTSYTNGLSSAGDDGWYKWQWGSKSPANSVSDRIHRNGLNLFKRPYNAWGTNWTELGHSTPPADPARYQSDNGLAMTMQFGNGLYTVDDAALMGEYSNAAGATLIHHYPLNEDDGGGFESNACTSLRPISLSDAFDAKFGYISVAVERAGPYSVIAEARALANGNPVNIGYLESSSMSRGFPAYVKRFNQALLSLPAVPLSTASGMSDNAQVIVRKTGTTANGTYYAVINPTLQAKSLVNITFPAANVKDLLTQTTHATTTLRMDLYPGEVRTFLVP